MSDIFLWSGTGEKDEALEAGGGGGFIRIENRKRERVIRVLPAYLRGVGG